MKTQPLNHKKSNIVVNVAHTLLLNVDIQNFKYGTERGREKRAYRNNR
jgi:hypothetical protein